MFLIYLYVFLLTETFPIPINVIYTDDRSETRSPINISPPFPFHKFGMYSSRGYFAELKNRRIAAEASESFGFRKRGGGILARIGGRIRPTRSLGRSAAETNWDRRERR